MQEAPLRIKRLWVEAVVTRADGSTEDLGVVADTSLWRRMARWAYLLLPGVGATLIVNTGRAVVTNRLVAGTLPPTFVGWGTGAGTTAATDTTLFTESAEARAAATATQQTTTTTNDTYRLVATLTASAGRAITNAGAFDASSAGNLYFKTDFAVVNLSTGDSLTLTFNTQLS